ncbi:hypothetical protein STEG23_020109, partial [Scotinomys teguina]
MLADKSPKDALNHSWTGVPTYTLVSSNVQPTQQQVELLPDDYQPRDDTTHNDAICHERVKDYFYLGGQSFLMLGAQFLKDSTYVLAVFIL